VETNVISKQELLRTMKLFFADQNRGISIDLFADLAGLGTKTMVEVFINQNAPLSEYVQRRTSKAYKAWRNGDVAVMKNRDNSKFVQYRKESKPKMVRGYGLQVVGGEIKLKLGVKNRADYDSTLAEQLDRG
jgi:hypothetical protein